jgi:transposase
MPVPIEESDGPPDPGVDQAWLDEIQRRSREFDEDLVEAIPAEKVFANLEAQLEALADAELLRTVRARMSSDSAPIEVQIDDL